MCNKIRISTRMAQGDRILQMCNVLNINDFFNTFRQVQMSATASSNSNCLLPKWCFSMRSHCTSIALPSICPLWATEWLLGKFSMLASLKMPKILGILNVRTVFLPRCHFKTKKALQWLKCMHRSRKVSRKSFFVHGCFPPFCHEILCFLLL